MARKPVSEKFRTQEGVFDEFTFKTLFALASKYKFSEETLSPINKGKESAVFQATRDGEQVALKIYFLSNANFNNMYSYIRVDPRFSHVKQRRRDIILAWCKREYSNLMLVQQAKMKAPQPIGYKNNVLIMNVIGNPAPQLKQQPPKNPEKFLEKVTEQMQILHKKGLVHGDLSPFNILNEKEEPYFIDFSHTQSFEAPRGKELLIRDCHNIATYFKKLGVAITEDELMKSIL